jgi:hypothetical protein
MQTKKSGLGDFFQGAFFYSLPWRRTIHYAVICAAERKIVADVEIDRRKWIWETARGVSG